LYAYGDATDSDIVKVCRQAQAEEFISCLPNQYDYKLERGGTNLSGGQKQRLCIARALLKKPKILILDDSTSAIDTTTDAKIREVFKKELNGITKIIIGQRILSIKDCDRIIVLENGEIDAIDTHQNLLKDNKIYKEIFATQQ
jgi:ATP-binding cassette subfamily B protein